MGEDSHATVQRARAGRRAGSRGKSAGVVVAAPIRGQVDDALRRPLSGSRGRSGRRRRCWRGDWRGRGRRRPRSGSRGRSSRRPRCWRGRGRRRPRSGLRGRIGRRPRCWRGDLRGRGRRRPRSGSRGRSGRRRRCWRGDWRGRRRRGRELALPAARPTQRRHAAPELGPREAAPALRDGRDVLVDGFAEVTQRVDLPQQVRALRLREVVADEPGLDLVRAVGLAHGCVWHSGAK